VALAALRHQQNFAGFILPFYIHRYFAITLMGEFRESCGRLREERAK
jgi:hypothetical protein